MRQPILAIPKKKNKNPEAALQAAVVQHIRLRGVHGLVWDASMSGVHLGIRAKVKMKEQGMERGRPDLTFLIGGHYYGLELKNGKKGVQSAEQKNFEKRVFASGGTYRIARDIDGAIALLEAWGVIRPRTVTKMTYRVAA